MFFKFIATTSEGKNVVVRADIENSTVEIRGDKVAERAIPHATERKCELCEKEKGICRAAVNVFELCLYFLNSRSIDHVDITVVYNNQNYSHTVKRADDAIMEMILVIIAASGCSRFGKLRWAWRYWNFETELDNIFYNLLSACLVAECIEGDIEAPLSRALESAHDTIKAMQEFVNSVVTHVQRDFSTEDSDAAANALVAIWAIGEIFTFQTDRMLDLLKERIGKNKLEANNHH